MHVFVVQAEGADRGRRDLGALTRALVCPTARVASLAALRADLRFGGGVRAIVLSAEAEVATLVEFAREQRDRAFVVHVADTIAPDAYKALVRTGAAEWVRWEDAEDELRDLAARPAAPTSDGQGSADEAAARIVTFLPSKGGVGTTTLLVEAAAHLAADRKRRGRVAILDLNLGAGTVVDALDVEPRFDIAQIAGNPERLDEHLVDVFRSQHSERLDVFAAPERTGTPEEVGPDAVFALLDVVGARYDVVLVDVPRHRLPWTDDLLRGSDAVVVVGGSGVAALRKLAARLRHLREIGVAEGKRTAIVNGVDVDLLGRVRRRDEVERVLAGLLSGSRLFFVRQDRAAIGEAADLGRPLAELMPRRAISRDLRRVADWIAGAADEAQRAPAGRAARREALA